MNPLNRVPLLMALMLCLSLALVLARPSPGLAEPPSALIQGQPLLGQPLLGLPVSPPTSIIQAFRAPLTAYGSGHRGIDLSVVDGQTVVAPMAGTVSFAGEVAYKPVFSVTTAGGFIVSVEPACVIVAAGTRVNKGQVLGSVCAAGYLSHCKPRICLHFSVRTPQGYLSPQFVLGQLGPSRLAR